MNRKKIDYVFKSQVIKSGLTKEERLIKKAFYADYVKNTTGKNIYSKYNLATAEDKQSFFLTNFAREYVEAEKINRASTQRSSRLRKRISAFLSESPCIFATLTFNDKVLNKTNTLTRRTYVRKYLESLGTSAVANIDFGLKNHREHYHAVIKADKINLNDWRVHGNINVERIHKTSDDVKLAKYISKLTNHAIKETTKRQAIMYIK